MALEDDVRKEVTEAGGKIKLMQKYSDHMTEIRRLYGGNISDVPVDPSHEYYQVRQKLHLLQSLEI